jgi:hypothetical protein
MFMDGILADHPELEREDLIACLQYARLLVSGVRCWPSTITRPSIWVHIRTTNPIESTFATVRLRTKRSRNCGSRETTLAMVFNPLQSAQKRWKRIKGFRKLELVVNNVRLRNGAEVVDQSDRVAA